VTTLAQAIAALEPSDIGWRGTVPANWLQGRTAYGGFSAALALHVAKASVPDLPPLRSALVAFVGPLAGTITVSAQLLRRGRNAAFVQADVTGESGLGLRATFVFMAALASTLDHATGGAPDVARPHPGDRTYRGLPEVAFSQNFELLDREAGPAEWLRWVRLADRDGLDPEVELIALADCLPPAALKLVGGFAPISSMTWQMNLLGQVAPGADGWYLLRADTAYARAGTSSQAMAIWAGDGTPLAEQMQSVAVFA
jgi:acyl-CoA thioesterase